MVEITYQMVLSTLQTIALIVGIVYYIVTMRNQTKTRQAQLFMQVYQHYTDRDWLRQQQEIQHLFDNYESYDEFMEKYGPHTNMEGFLTWNSRGNFYEGLGVLLQRGLIDPTMVDDLLSGPIVLYWERRVAPIIDELRERFNNPAAYEWVEYLYREIKQIRDKQHPEYAGTAPAGGPETMS
jgi:hypothetical protein